MEDTTNAQDAVLNVQDSSTKGNGNNFWKGLLRTILGITISIILTFGTNGLIQHHRKEKDRKMTAMMVLSNIESFARTLEIRSNRMAPNDSIAAWLLCMSYEDLELLPAKELDNLISQATSVATLNRDHTAQWAMEVPEAIHDVQVNPDQYVATIEISEQEVMEFTNAREEKGEDVGRPLMPSRSTPAPIPSAASLPSLTLLIALRN